MDSKLHVTTTAERGGLSIKLNALVRSIVLKVTIVIHNHNMITWYKERVMSNMVGVGGGSTKANNCILNIFLLDARRVTNIRITVHLASVAA